MNKRGTLGKLVGGFVAIAVGIMMFPMINSTFKLAVSNLTISSQSYENLTGTPFGTFLNLVPGFFVLGMITIGIAVTWGALRNAGMFESDPFDGNATGSALGIPVMVEEVIRDAEKKIKKEEAHQRDKSQVYVPKDVEKKNRFDESN